MMEKPPKVALYFRRKNIRFLLSICFTISAVVGVVFLGISLFYQFMTMNQKTLEENNERIVDQVNISLNGYLRSMMKVSDMIYYRSIKNCDLSQENFVEDMNLLYEANRENLVSIAVFRTDGTLVDATPLGFLKKSAHPQTQGWFMDATSKIENIHFSTLHVQNLFEDKDYKYPWVVSISRGVDLTYGGKTERGVLLVDMNFVGIEQLLSNVHLSNAGYLYLMNKQGEIIYHPRQQLLYSNLKQENTLVASNYEDGSHFEEFEGKKRLVTVKTVGYTGWKIIGVMPVEAVWNDLMQIRVFVIFMLLATILLLIVANRFVSSKIAEPILNLEKSVKELEKGKLDVPIAIGGTYEIRHLGETIQSMANQLRKLMDDIVVEQESKRKSEFDALQSQINPHFLYNTLDSIVWMVENQRYREAIVMVTSLAGFFRIGLSKGRRIISVADELKHAKNYITIQHMRFRDQFTFSIDAQEEVLSLATIKLIVQPLLENAVYHGMESMDGEGEIHVKAYLHETELYIDVIDNGMGMTQEEVDQLLQRERIHRGKGSGIGLRNVHERIRLYFGEAYGLEIFSEPDEGTTVRIHLPQKPYREEEKWKEENHVSS